MLMCVATWNGSVTPKPAPCPAISQAFVICFEKTLQMLE